MTSIDPEIHLEIKRFAEAIVQRDMCADLLVVQQQRWGPFVRNLLPLDSAAEDAPKLFTQLLKSIGNGAGAFEEALVQISPTDQDRGILCAAAASGMGKTHLAYDVGKRHFMILIRVMGNSGDCNGDQGTHKSPPWDAAIGYMERVKRECAIDDITERAKAMLRFIKLLLYTYLEFTSLAFSYIQIEDLPRKKEFVLRLHRNVVADDLISRLFLFNVQSMQQESSCIIDADKLRAYRSSVQDSTKKWIPDEEKLIFCVDEINGLVSDFPHDFVRRKIIDSGEHLVDVGAESRGLMYAVFCVLKKLCSTKSSWICYVTGTALSVAKFQSEIDGISVARGSMIPISLETLLSVDDMMQILQHYFSLDATSISILRAKLSSFVGRPHFFARGVFEPLFAMLPKNVDAHELSADMVANWQWMNPSYLESQYLAKYRNFFCQNVLTLPSGTKNARVFLPMVIRAHLCDGVYRLPTSDVLEGAVFTGILPMGVSTKQTEIYEIDLKQEPIIRKAIGNFVHERICTEDGVRVLLSMMADIGGEKGKLAELIFCMFVVLQVAKALRQGEPLELYSLIESLTEEAHRKLQWVDSCGYIVECNNIVDISRQANIRTQSFLRMFVKPDQTYDFGIILINIDPLAGADIAFLARNRTTSQPRLVLLQAKNQQSGTLDDSPLTLNPGCQYLINEQRIWVIDSLYNGKQTTKKKPAILDHMGYGSPVWKDHVDVCHQHPQLSDDCIRMSLNARPVSNKLLRCIQEMSSGKHSQWSQMIRGDDKLEKITTSLAKSPLIVLSMRQTTYLTQSGHRALFLTQSTTPLSVPKQFRLWVAVTASQVEKLFQNSKQ